MPNMGWCLRGSYAFRVLKDDFEQILEDDNKLKKLIKIIDMKNYILNFQYDLININKEKFSHLLQGVIDENKIIKIIPKDLDSFFKICFILDNMNKVSENANLWLIYLLNYIKKDNTLNEISKIVYCMDFLYSKIELKSNELNSVIDKNKELFQFIKKYLKIWIILKKLTN